MKKSSWMLVAFESGGIRTSYPGQLNQWLKGQRRFDGSRVPSATCPRESVLPIRLRSDFFVVFEGYAGEAEHLLARDEAWKWSLGAIILWT